MQFLASLDYMNLIHLHEIYSFHNVTLLLLTHGSRPAREGVRPWQGLPGRRAAPAPRQHLFFIKK
ncbi:hypothetical protein AVEN_214369-1, partial [Araneus ventricosus]